MSRRIALCACVYLLFLFAAAPVGAEDEAITNFEAASVEIGQKNFAGAGCTKPAANTLCLPYGEVVALKKLYIVDADYSRVLGFTSVPKKSHPSASILLGQTKFSTAGRGAGKTAFSFPTAVAFAGTQLFVNDFSNNRVLIWNKLPTKSRTPADVVVGQPDFTSTTGALSQTGLRNPEAGLAVAGGKLFVSDRDNNRVLIWNEIPKSDGAPADVVIGQPDFTSGNNGVSQTALNEPEGIWSDGTRLVVADFLNSRVLIWNTIPTANDTPADVVVGQEDFTSGAAPNPPTAESLSRPYGVASDGSRLFVADTFNNRILVYSPFPTTNNPTASIVFGQSDFTHNAANAGAAKPSAQTLSNPYGIFVNGKQLFVSDHENSRVLIFGI